jgi:hypothetical protein
MASPSDGSRLAALLAVILKAHPPLRRERARRRERRAGARGLRPNYERLVAMKHTDDPTNFFRLNQIIKPTV